MWLWPVRAKWLHPPSPSLLKFSSLPRNNDFDLRCSLRVKCWAREKESKGQRHAQPRCDTRWAISLANGLSSSGRRSRYPPPIPHRPPSPLECRETILTTFLEASSRRRHLCSFPAITREREMHHGSITGRNTWKSVSADPPVSPPDIKNMHTSNVISFVIFVTYIVTFQIKVYESLNLPAQHCLIMQVVSVGVCVSRLSYSEPLAAPSSYCEKRS